MQASEGHVHQLEFNYGVYVDVAVPDESENSDNDDSMCLNLDQSDDGKLLV